ncbi:hypothetical protein L2E82_31546 [Cichorium intybus]|uniref:Uncharacterized protein n=1 Tax=Cichorium intybus TaxID=13427 RepID=A0ACB9BDU4_CICIN|nr:hypothetical protein L2E82_31546 [Cichorium intybus]
MAISMSTTTPSALFTPPNASPIKTRKIPRVLWPWQKVKSGPTTVSPMGFGTWAWGNQLLWGYQESMDTELQQIFNIAVDNVASGADWNRTAPLVNCKLCSSSRASTLGWFSGNSVKQAEENLGALGWKLRASPLPRCSKMSSRQGFETLVNYRCQNELHPSVLFIS